MTSSKISSSQLVILLLISKIFTVLNYITSFHKEINNTALIWGNIYSFIFQLLLIIPALILYQRFKEENVLQIAYRLYKPFGIILAIFYFLDILLNIIISMVSFEYFMSNAVFPDASAIFLLFTIGISCFYAAISGIEGLARASLFVFVFLILGGLFLGFASIPNIDLINFKPIIDHKTQTILYSFIDTTAKNSELILLMLLFPKVKGNIKKSSFLFIILSFVAVEILGFLIVTILGDLAYMQSFPYYSLATIIETPMLQRMDAIHMVAWVLISFIKISLLAIVGNECLLFFFPYKLKKLSMLILFILAFSISLYICSSSEIVKKIHLSNPVTVIILVAIVPLLLLLLTKKKEDISYEKDNSFVSYNQ